MSSTPFGEHLRREREMRGVSLEEIAAATRINTRFLEAIESERWDQLPGGVFNRGFIRSIARYLGMDEDSLVAEYDLDTQSNGNSHPAVILPAEKKKTSRNWQPAAVAVALLVILVAAGASAIHYRAKISAGFHRGVSAIAVRAHRYHSKPGSASSAMKSASEAAPGASARSNSASSVSATDPGSVPLTLKLEAGKAAQVKIVADGNTIFDGPVQPNDVKQFQARDTFDVSSSDSSAVLLELNGQTVPPIGTPGEPGAITLTRSDIGGLPGDPH